MTDIKRDEYDSINSDPGPMYQKPWVQKLIRQIQNFLLAQAGWLDIDCSKPQRVLDYACGDGTVSAALLESFPKTTFRGLDIAISQVKRYNDTASRLYPGSDVQNKMMAIQGDLNDLQGGMTQPEWFDFDAAIISMALHHIQDPTTLLKHLRERVKSGGSLVVIDWLKQSVQDMAANTTESRMIRLSEGPQIWPGFSIDDIETHLRAAGCVGVDVIVWPEKIEAPKEMEGYSRMFIAKAEVASYYSG